MGYNSGEPAVQVHLAYDRQPSYTEEADTFLKGKFNSERYVTEPSSIRSRGLWFGHGIADLIVAVAHSLWVLCSSLMCFHLLLSLQAHLKNKKSDRFFAGTWLEYEGECHTLYGNGGITHSRLLFQCGTRVSSPRTSLPSLVHGRPYISDRSEG